MPAGEKLMKNWLTSCIRDLRRPVPFCLLLTVLLALSVCANITLGAAQVSLPEILQILADADTRLKTSAADGRTVLETTLVEIFRRRGKG